jgi:hypothetical protein
VTGRWHGEHDELRPDGELLQNLHTRRGGCQSESPTARWMGKNRARWSSPLAEGKGSARMCSGHYDTTFI